MKKTLLSALLTLMVSIGLQAQTVYSTAFSPTDDNTAWTMSSATVNQWQIGHPAAEASDTGWLYISQDGGTANTYNLTASTKAWASHDVTLAGGIYTFSFRWKCMGESNFDYLRCVLVPDTVVLDTTPFATYQETAEFRFAVPDGWINLALNGANLHLNQSATWQTSTVSFSVLNPGNYKIAFLWVNDNSDGTQPPAVVDDVTLAIDNTCPPVAHLELNHISLDSTALTWDAVYGAQYLVQIDNLPPVVVDTNRYVIPFIMDVNLSVTAKVWALCASGDTSAVAQQYFYDNGAYTNIGCSAYELPYFEDFDYNTYNNSLGFCWWRRQTTQYENMSLPLVNSGKGIGGSAALWFARYFNGNSYGTLYSPYFDAPANELDVSFWIRVIGPNEGVGEVSDANASLTVGVADADIETAAANIFCSQSLLHFDYSDLDTAWQFVHFTTDTIDMNYINGNVRLAFLWYGNTAGIYIDNLKVTRLGEVHDSVPPMVVIGGPSAVQVLDTVVYRADLVEGTDSAMSYSWQSAMAAAGQATVISAGDTLRIVYTAIGTDTLTLTATNPYGSDNAVRAVTVEGAPQVRIAFAPYNVNNGVWLTFTHEYLGGPNLPYTITWHSNLASAGQAQIDTTHGDTLRIRYIGTGNDVITLTAANIFDTCIATRPVVVSGCVVNTFPFTAIYDYDGVIDNACWLKLQHGGGGDIYDGWGYSFAGEGGVECMHWEGQPAGEYLLALPPLALPNEGLQLRFKALGTAVTDGMFSVVVSPTADASAFTDTLPLTPDSISDYYIASLAPYAGQLVLVAFRMAAPEGTGTSVYLLREVSIRHSLSPEVTVQGYSKATTCDTMLFTANLIMGDTTDLTYTWTSTKAASGNAVMVADGPRLKIAYSSWGTDVVSVTVSNSYGNYTATCTTQVMTCQEIDSPPRTWVLSVSSTDRYDWQQNRIVSPRGNLSNSYVPSTSWWSPGLWDGIYSLQSNISSDSDVNAWLVSPPIVLDTAVVLRWHAECDNSAYSVRLSPTPYTVGIDGYIDTAYFTETLYTESGASDWSSHEANLSQWQGHTVHIAWVHHGPATDPSDVRAGIRLDTVSIECAAPDTTPVVDTVWHTVTVNTNVEGAAEPYGSGTYAHGDTVEIGLMYADTVAHGGHWDFLGWSDGPTEQPRNIVVSSDTVITALFQWVADTSSGIGDIVNSKLNVEIYPNPAHGNVTIKTSEPATLELLDISGHVVIHTTPFNSTFIIPHTTLQPGIYFVRIGAIVRKLVIK